MKQGMKCSEWTLTVLCPVALHNPCSSGMRLRRVAINIVQTGRATVMWTSKREAITGGGITTHLPKETPLALSTLCLFGKSIELQEGHARGT